MRQAGRYMDEYQAIRKDLSFLELCKNPELCCEVAMQPINAFGLETSIVFSDILLPAEAMGLDLSFGDGGPKLANPVRSLADIEALKDFDPAIATPWPAEAVKLTKKALGKDRALIGFCGAPFTLASYMIEGKSSRQFENTKRLMWHDPKALELLLDRLTQNLIPYLRAQIEAGADAVQIFDSWAGCLGVDAFDQFALDWTRKLVAGVADLGVPVIYYVNGCDHVLEQMAGCGVDVISIDWRVDPQEAVMRVGGQVAIQGNMDPGVLLGPPEVAVAEFEKNVAAFQGNPGYIFNLGSGVMQWSPVETVAAVAKALRDWRPRD